MIFYPLPFTIDKVHAPLMSNHGSANAYLQIETPALLTFIGVMHFFAFYCLVLNVNVNDRETDYNIILGICCEHKEVNARVQCPRMTENDRSIFGHGNTLRVVYVKKE